MVLFYGLKTYPGVLSPYHDVDIVIVRENTEDLYAVIREMQEETGFRPQRVERLNGFYSTPGFCNEYLYLYLATELTPGRLHAEDTPGIEVVRVPVTQIPDLIASGKIEDAKTMAGLLYYLEYCKKT